MEFYANHQLTTIVRTVTALTDRILDSTEKLKSAVERAKAGAINTDGFAAVDKDFDTFGQHIASVRTGAERMLEAVNALWTTAGEIKAISKIVSEENICACSVFSRISEMLRDEKSFGRIDDLESMLAGQMVLLDVLRSDLDSFCEEANKAAVRAENEVNAGGVWGDASLGEDAGFDGDAWAFPDDDICAAPDCAWSSDAGMGFFDGDYGNCEAGCMSDSCYVPDPPISAGQMPAPVPVAPMPAPAPMAGSASAKQARPEPVKPKKVKPVRVDSVSFSVLSPEHVKAGEYSSLDVYMYTKSQRKIIDKAIKDAKSAVKETGKSGFSVSRGTEVSVILSSDSEDIKITDPVDTRTWDGECSQFDFQFFVPEDYSKKQIAFTCQVLFGGIQITRLHFTVGLSGGSAERVPVKVKRKDCRKAFVSYSHKDEKRVLNLLSEIVSIAPRMVFWLDSQSMESGDIWRKEIRRAIRNADVFLLFWSIYSSKSAEVEKEWRYARQKRGIRFILPVPLDPPAECPPPEELGKHLHFGHRSLARTDEMNGLTFASSKQFRKIK